METSLLIVDELLACLHSLYPVRTLERFRTHAANGGGALVVLHGPRPAARFSEELLQGGRWVAGRGAAGV